MKWGWSNNGAIRRESIVRRPTLTWRVANVFYQFVETGEIVLWFDFDDKYHPVFSH